MNQLIEELQWRGLTLPTEGRTKYKSRCPVCSPTREKKNNRCAKITILSDDRADLYCYHCGHQDEVRT